MSTLPFFSNDGFSTIGNITTTGNISGSYFIGDGSLLTGIAPTVQVYEFANVASGVSNYYSAEWLASYTPAALANVSVSVTTTATNIINFITDPGYPGITVIPTGTILVRAETTKGSGPQGYLIYAEIYKRTTGGTETLIATTDNSSVITQNAAVQQNVIAYITTPVTLDVTDRIVVKVFGQMTSGSATITFSFDDNTGAGLQLPALPASVNNFVPYTGATANVDLGTRSLATTGNITAGNISTTTNVAVSGSIAVTGNASANNLSVTSGTFGNLTISSSAIANATTIGASGNITTSANLVATASVFGDNLYITNTANVANINVSGSANLSSANTQVLSFGVGTAASGVTGEIRATNNITAFYSSDRRFKENIVEISDALDKVNAIGGKFFDWTDEYITNHGGADEYFLRKHDVGVIAQDVQLVFPEVVRKRPDGSLAVDYHKLSALAFAAIKELSEQIAELRTEINNLKG